MASLWPSKGKRPRSNSNGEKELADTSGHDRHPRQTSQRESRSKWPRLHGLKDGKGQKQDLVVQTSQTSDFGVSIPLELSVLKFAESRARELEALSQAAEHIGGTKLSFQRLPRHMIRRAMSHNIRRIPRRLRMIAQAELEKREKKSVNKRPSRRHRRRPSNLFSEYQRRQRQNSWLETHIWHAKRFKMTTAWGYRLPVHPCDKSLRACYRATTFHCLLQDVSYECCIEMRGDHQVMVEALSHICSKDAGLTFAAKATHSGQRWGKVMLYSYDTYPRGAVAPVTFLWKPEVESELSIAVKEKDTTGRKEHKENNSRSLWVWCHPASYTIVWAQLSYLCDLTSSSLLSSDSISSASDPRGLEHEIDTAATTKSVGSGLQLHSLKDQLIKFRLTGPASNLVLSETLKIATVNSVQENQLIMADSSKSTSITVPWWQEYYSTEENLSLHSAQFVYWEQVANCQLPNEIPPNAVLALTVRDPRVLMPSARTKVTQSEAGSATNQMKMDLMPFNAAVSPLWEEVVRDEITRTRMTEQEMNKLRSQLLVSGSVLQLGDKESRIPVLLLQRPGCQPTTNRQPSGLRAGVGSGWDLIVPKGWGMAFWVAMVYRGARVGGLREARSLSSRSGFLHFPHDFPDTSAGFQQLEESGEQLVEAYVRRPPAKRVNYHRLGVSAPFHCPFAQLVAEWKEKAPSFLNSLVKLETCTPENNIKASVRDIVGNRGDDEKSVIHDPKPCVLRDRKLLLKLHSAMQKPNLKHNSRQKFQRSSYTRLASLLDQYVALVSKNLHSLVPVEASCVLRGVPQERAMICLPSEADLQQLARDSNFGPVEHLHPHGKTNLKSRKGIAEATPASGGSESDGKKQHQKTDKVAGKCSKNKVAKKSLNEKQLLEKSQLLKKPSKIVDATGRQIIGFLTAGDFDLGRGCGSGIGFCSLIGLLAALKHKTLAEPVLVLLRNTTSRQYRFAHLSLLL